MVTNTTAGAVRRLLGLAFVVTQAWSGAARADVQKMTKDGVTRYRAAAEGMTDFRAGGTSPKGFYYTVETGAGEEGCKNYGLDFISYIDDHREVAWWAVGEATCNNITGHFYAAFAGVPRAAGDEAAFKAFLDGWTIGDVPMKIEKVKVEQTVDLATFTAAGDAVNSASRTYEPDDLAGTAALQEKIKDTITGTSRSKFYDLVTALIDQPTSDALRMSYAQIHKYDMALSNVAIFSSGERYPSFYVGSWENVCEPDTSCFVEAR